MNPSHRCSHQTLILKVSNPAITRQFCIGCTVPVCLIIIIELLRAVCQGCKPCLGDRALQVLSINVTEGLMLSGEQYVKDNTAHSCP